MRSSCTSERWTKMAALLVLIGQTLVAGGPANAAVGQEALLPPTPLVLKDGRIANVSIHVLPFERGDGELTGDAAAGLAKLTAQVATDCFLTAQVIGHVSSREVADNETLAAHRLARSRADAVQSSLIGGGLPAKSIASVWDWQFLVREPRATLWVFRLIQGEDCEGLPLDGEAPQLVAENVPAQAQPVQAETSVSEVAAPASQARAVAEPEAAPAPPAADPTPRVADVQAPAPAPASEPVDQATVAPTLPPMVGSAVAAEAAPHQGEIEDVLIAEATAAQAPHAAPSHDAAGKALPGRQTQASADADHLQEESHHEIAKPQGHEEVAVPAGPAGGAVPTVTRPMPALSPSQTAVATPVDEQTDTTVAAIEPAQAAGGTERASAGSPAPQQSAKQENPDRQGKVEWGQDGNVVITFATNSSYFPPGTTRRLGKMLDGMASDQRYHVQLQVGVSGADKVVGATTPEEARRYNKWLAERRMARVQEWLAENARDRQLEIEPVFLADDSSRRVQIRIAPVS